VFGNKNQLLVQNAKITQMLALFGFPDAHVCVSTQ